MRKIWLFAILAAVCVSAIIILASSNPCPRGCRWEERRASDLRQIQYALDLYFKKCGVFPGGALRPDSDSACVSISRPSQLSGKAFYNDPIPKDPVTGADYSYCHTVGGASYALQANLIPQDPALINSLSAPPAGCTDTVGTVTCDKSKGEYCVGPFSD